MKILGHTPEGDLIIQVAQEEWNLLQDGVKPRDSVEEGYERWLKTEACKFLDDRKGRSFKLARTPFRWKWLKGEFDGTIAGLKKILNEGEIIGNIGPKIRSDLLEALKDK